MIRWTAEELAEMAAADAEIDKEDDIISYDEIVAARARDRAARIAMMPNYMQVKPWRKKYNQKARSEEDRQKKREYRYAYYRTHRDAIRERIKVYNAQPEQRAKKKAYDAAYRAAHKEQIAAYQKQYREAHKEKIAAYMRQYREDHREELKAYAQMHRKKKRMEIIDG